MQASIKYYLTALFRSLYCREFYQDLIKNQKITGLKYLFLLALIVSIPVALLVDNTIQKIVSFAAQGNFATEKNTIISQIPEITFDEGSFKTKSEQEHKIFDQQGNLVIYVNTAIKNVNPENFDNLISLTSDEMTFIINGVAIPMPAAQISKSLEMYFSDASKSQSYFNFSEFLSDLLIVSQAPAGLLILMSFLWFSLRYILSVVLYSFLVSMFWGNMIGITPQNFRRFLRIAVFTSTPIAILEAINFSLGGNLFNYSQTIYFLLHLIYIHYSIESFRGLEKSQSSL